MTEPTDVYADQFVVTVGPYGASLSFDMSVPHPSGPGQAPQPPQRVATIRMSTEHLKSVAYIIVKHVKQIEQQGGVKYDVPSQVLAQLGIGREDWDSFWA